MKTYNTDKMETLASSLKSKVANVTESKKTLSATLQQLQVCKANYDDTSAKNVNINFARSKARLTNNNSNMKNISNTLQEITNRVTESASAMGSVIDAAHSEVSTGLSNIEDIVTTESNEDFAVDKETLDEVLTEIEEFTKLLNSNVETLKKLLDVNDLANAYVYGGSASDSELAVYATKIVNNLPLLDDISKIWKVLVDFVSNIKSDETEMTSDFEEEIAAQADEEAIDAADVADTESAPGVDSNIWL